MKQVILSIANLVKGQLWGDDGKEARKFLKFHLLNLLWFFGEMFGTVLFHPLLMVWGVTIIFLFIPEYRGIGFGLIGAYIFTIIAMRIEAKRYTYKEEEVDLYDRYGKKRNTIKLVLKYCKYSGYKVKRTFK